MLIIFFKTILLEFILTTSHLYVEEDVSTRTASIWCALLSAMGVVTIIPLFTFEIHNFTDIMAAIQGA